MLEKIMIIAVTIMMMPHVLGFLSVFKAARADIMDAIKAGIYIIYIVLISSLVKWIPISSYLPGSSVICIHKYKVKPMSAAASSAPIKPKILSFFLLNMSSLLHPYEQIIRYFERIANCYFLSLFSLEQNRDTIRGKRQQKLKIAGNKEMML